MKILENVLNISLYISLIVLIWLTIYNEFIKKRTQDVVMSNTSKQKFNYADADVMLYSNELELNRGYMYEADGEPIAETIYVVSYFFANKIYNKYLKEKWKLSFEDFLDAYVPEEDGLFIYEKAKEQKALIEDLGVCTLEFDNDTDDNNGIE
jgi:hypothetical protein